MVACPACGHENREGRRYCADCGAALAGACTSCGFTNESSERFCGGCGAPLATEPTTAAAPSVSTSPQPSSFANGRYQLVRLLGEGGKKRVYLAHDTLLDRDVAFALIKTEGLDEAGRQRVRREARAMGRLGSHPNIVAVLDLGEEADQPYLVTELMPGGDLDALLATAPDQRLPLKQAVDLGRQLCQALEHAHARELIHRDLKPGNVWLTADSTAKLGDFGLALALDRTRHTQPGMMVGTVSYMAPEQATGAEVTARSDLYALGCVLYELVCGRPPYVGDDAVAIIGQHLNTPPVAPSWHRPDCPPGLEALILRLLEKDPAKRPQSAAELLTALAGLDLRVPPQSPHTQGEASPVSLPPFHGGTEGGYGGGTTFDSPLYHRAFVGRESELKQLHAAFDAALSGQGGLVMVVGEPGIGKTSLTEQLATFAVLRGGKALVGHCYEEGSLSLPYLPFVEAMRSYVLDRDPDGLKTDLGSGAGEVARIVSEVRDRVRVTPSESGHPDEQRWRLLEAVTGFLRNASQVQPLLLVLEDLHDADRGTLDLLVHMARSLEGARLLVVGTYRDVEVDRSHPLSSALAELRRVQTFMRVPLRGLTVDEVHRLYTILRGHEVSWAQAEAVHRQTEGNPLFIQEVLRYLVEAGLVVRQGDRYVPQVGTGEGIPEGLRDVIGKRLSRLSETTNQTLSVAAVIGRDFRLEVLQRVSTLPEEAIIAALEEATERAVVEVRTAVGGGVAYRFTHAFFRQTLYEELSPPRRIRWHQQVARALEDVYGRRVEEHAAELAEHFAHSSDHDDLRKAVSYGELAARRAMSVYAYGEAVRHLERALEVQEVLDPDDAAKRCDLLVALGEALIPAGDAVRVVSAVAEEACRLAEDSSDAQRAATACLLAMDAISLSAGTTAQGTGSDQYEYWVNRADGHAAAGTVGRVYVDVALAAVLRQKGREYDSWNKCRQALEAALAVDAEDALIQAASYVAIAAVAPTAELSLSLDAANLIWERFVLPDKAVRPALVGPSTGAIAQFLTWGHRDRAEQVAQKLETLAAKSRDPAAGRLSRTWQAILATWDGELERALELADEVQRLGEETGQEGAGRQWAGLARRRALFYLGRPADVLASIPRPAQLWTTGGVFASQQAVYLAHSGRADAATEIIDEFMKARDFSAPDDTTPAALLRYLLEAAVAAGHVAAASVLEPVLEPLADLLFTEPYITNCMGRDLGGAARLLGHSEKAFRYYQRGSAACIKSRHRPELALCRLELAELLLDQALGDQPSSLRTDDDSRHLTADELRADGIRLLDLAIGELRDMKMQTFLERALRRKLGLQGVDSVSPSTSIDAVAVAVAAERPDLRPHAAPDGTVTILFSDIEGYSAMTTRLGDAPAQDVLRAHHALVRQQIAAHGGFEVKSQGDSFMIAFASARRALQCAIAIQQAVASDDALAAEGVRVRMGLHTGEAIKEGDDFFGTSVILAARIAARAHGGQILVSELLRGLVGSLAEVELRDAGRKQLKGLPGRQRVYEAVWDD